MSNTVATPRNRDQVRQIIETALEEAGTLGVPLIDKLTRLRAARCFAQEAFMAVWVEAIDDMILVVTRRGK